MNKYTKQISREEFQRIEKAKTQLRTERAAELVYKGKVCIVNHKLSYVQSQSDEEPDNIYEVTDTQCECPFFERYNVVCKHIWAFRFAKA